MKAPSRKIKASQWDRNHKSSSGVLSKRVIVWLAVACAIVLLYSMRPESTTIYTIDYSSSSSMRVGGRPAAVAPIVVKKQHLEPTPNMTASEVSDFLAAMVRHQQREKKNNKTTIQMYQQEWGIVHLGKCGGVSLKSTLMHYFGSQTRVATVAKRAKWFHLGKPEVEKFRYWMLLVRDPIARIQSWWMYDHMDNFEYRIDYLGFPFRSNLWPKLFECYKTLDDFCTKGLAPLEQQKEEPINECQLLAQMAIPPRGSSHILGFQHLRFNFDRYFAPLLQVADDKKLHVVRAEHMLSDVNAINQLLGDNSRSVQGLQPVSHWRYKEYPMKDRSISKEGLVNLCRQLCTEIQHYKDILEAGINIEETQLEASMNILKESCPIQAAATDCPMNEELWANLKPTIATLAQNEMAELTQDRLMVLAQRKNPPPRMDKAVRMRDHFRPDSEESYGVVHLSRCGGHTLRGLLESQKESSNLFKKLETSWMPNEVAIWPHHNHWVLPVRNPIDRVMSWWAYHHPDNLSQRPDQQEQLDKPAYLRAELNHLYTCFPTFQEFVMGSNTPGVDVQCRQSSARSTVARPEMTIPSMESAGFSYDLLEKHIKETNPDGRFLWVARLEHVVEDLNGMEDLLNNEGSGAVFSNEEAQRLQPQYSTESWPVSPRQELDENAMSVLCKRICKSISMYEFILLEAVNLSSEAVDESMDAVRAKCPEYSAEECTKLKRKGK